MLKILSVVNLKKLIKNLNFLKLFKDENNKLKEEFENYELKLKSNEKEIVNLNEINKQSKDDYETLKSKQKNFFQTNN